MGQTSFEENKIIYFSLHIWNQKCSIHYPVLHNQNLVIFTCGFIKFILQENETLHRETVHGLGYDVVTKLVEPFYRKHHHVVVDNGFTSPLLCRDMFDNQTYLTGTVRATRKNMPKRFRNMKLQKGERVVRQSGAIMALKYGDRKTVCLLSSIYPPR